MIYLNESQQANLLRDLETLATPKAYEYFDDLEFIFEAKIPLDPEYLEEIQEILK